MYAFNPTKTKVQLKLAVNRLKLLQQKKTAINQAARKDIADLLSKGKQESARIRVENIIREDLTVEALELMELYTETLLARFGLLESMRHCDPALSEAVNTVIYASPRIDIPEMQQVRDQLLAKFGKEFGLAAMENLNDIMIQKLKLQTPDAVLVNHYLAEIAKAYKVDWSPAETEADPQGPFQSSVQQDQLYQSAPSYSVEVKLPISQQPAESAGQLFPEIPSGQSAGASSSGPDFEELEKRFEALKKKK